MTLNSTLPVEGQRKINASELIEINSQLQATLIQHKAKAALCMNQLVPRFRFMMILIVRILFLGEKLTEHRWKEFDLHPSILTILAKIILNSKTKTKTCQYLAL